MYVMAPTGGYVQHVYFWSQLLAEAPAIFSFTPYRQPEPALTHGIGWIKGT